MFTLNRTRSLASPGNWTGRGYGVKTVPVYIIPPKVWRYREKEKQRSFSWGMAAGILIGWLVAMLIFY